MADTQTVYPGATGTPFVVATDDAGAGGHVQLVKLALSADGSASPITADANGLEVQGAGVAGTPAGGVVSVQGVASGTVLPVSDGGGSLTVDGTVTANLAAGTNNIGDVDVLTVPTDPFGANADAASATGSISAKLRFIASTGIPITGTVTVGSHAVTNAGTFAVQDSEKLADNAAFTDGTTKVQPAGFIYDEVAGTALTENDVAAGRINVNRAQVGILEDGATRGRYATVSAANALKVDGSAVTQPVSGTVTANLAAGTNNIGDVDVLTVPADPFGANADAASATGSISAKLRFIASTGIPITGTVTVGSHAVTNAGTFAVQDSEKVADDAAFTIATTKVLPIGMLADDTSSDSVDEGDVGVPRMTLARKQIVVSTADSATLANVAASASSVTLQAANANRVGWSVYNDSTAILYVKFGGTASTTSYTVQVGGGSFYEMPMPIYRGVIDGIWASATGNARVTELA